MITIDLSDVLMFLIFVCGVTITWSLGYVYGLREGYDFAVEEGVSEYPILNVTTSEIEDGRFMFYEAVSGQVIVAGTYDDCFSRLAELGDNRRVIFCPMETEDKEKEDEQSV